MAIADWVRDIIDLAKAHFTAPGTQVFFTSPLQVSGREKIAPPYVIIEGIADTYDDVGNPLERQFTMQYWVRRAGPEDPSRVLDAFAAVESFTIAVSGLPQAPAVFIDGSPIQVVSVESPVAVVDDDLFAIEITLTQQMEAI